ncbi:rod shape-determining protein MreD [Aquibacillus albus]|uniref:Rod shape-determining protein MreD n=1 Tax=Aquibacillus albus TaxID=1168171 RepID=A0ABS2N1M2_9BACI|nr:rod shape-determining protein MreD [Aquibacillus albus]MBM7572030.1 rod shape-determining protein MreD [Aquibacillus albus]
MHRFYLPFFLLLTIVIEGVAYDFLPRSLVAGNWMIIPHWLFVFLIMITIFFDFEDTYYSVLYAIIFGLIVDIVYTNVIGVYMFIYAIVIYFIHGIRKVLHTNVFVALLSCIIGVGLADLGIYIIYYFIGINDVLWNNYIIYRLAPTVIANVLFFLVIYPFIKRKLIRWSSQQFDIKK